MIVFTAVGALLVAMAFGVVVGRWSRGRRSAIGGGVAAPAGTHLLAEPALEWLRRAHGALGVWVAELDPSDGGPRAERFVDAERLGVAQIVAADRRLERARDHHENGSERLDAGIFVFRAAAGRAVGMLLPFDTASDLARVGDDLDRLLDGIRRRPEVVAQAQARARDTSFESASSVGLRLAYQIERMLVVRGLDVEVVVVAADGGAARVIGMSGRGDRRLLDSPVPAESAIALVAGGASAGEADANGLIVSADPLGRLPADRRQSRGGAILFPLVAASRPVGAVAVWCGGTELLPAATRAELLEALANAAPRLARAMVDEERSPRRMVDRLTGLCSRQGFEAAVAEGPGQDGVVIVLDLDRLAALNDALGESAGDAALVHVGRLIQGQIRAGDVAARLGDDEFALWVPRADVELGLKVAERIRKKIAATPWSWNGRPWPIEASFGVAERSTEDEVPQVIIEKADAAAHLAKRNGGNRVEKEA